MGLTRRWPWWLAAAALGTAFAAAAFLVTLVAMPDEDLGSRSSYSVIPAIAFGILTAVDRRRSGGEGLLRDPGFRRAARRGAVPRGVDIDEWRRAVEQHRHQWRVLRRTAPPLFIPMTGVCIWLAETIQWRWWIFAALFVVALIGVLVVAPSVLRKTDAMLAELDRRD